MLTPLAEVPQTILGTIFRDYDADGTMDTLEPGVAGVTVTAYAPDGTAATSVTTDSNGDYALAGLTDGVEYRIEVTGYPSYLQPGPTGSDCHTTVMFATSPAVDYRVGLGNPADYCQINPDLITPVHDQW